MSETTNSLPPRPVQTLLGMVVSGGIAFLAYLFNHQIREKLPVPLLTNDASLADKLSALIRTLIIALTTGAMMIFATIAIGLLLLTIKSGFTAWLGKPTKAE